MAPARLRGSRWSGLYRDASGAQRHAGTYGTEEEALHWAKVAELDANPPKPREPEMEIVYRHAVRGKVTVAAYAPQWLESQILEPTSHETYQRTLKRIVEHIGGKAKDEVSPEDIKRMVKGLRESGLRDSTIASTVDVARSLLGEEACAGVHVRIRDHREILVATPEQAQAIVDTISARYKLLIRTGFWTGCRWGELIAVRGTDVQARGGAHVLRIRRTIIEVAGERSERDWGKSQRAMRDISLPGDLARELAAFGGELCFTNARRGYLRRNAFRSAYWKPTVVKVGIPALRVHDMRHTAISEWVQAGISLDEVMYRAGHSSIGTTSKYIHVRPGREDPFLALALGRAS